MKKFCVPLFFFLLFSCSTEGFKSEKAASAQKDVWCGMLDGKCSKISESLCLEIGGTPGCSNDVSSSSDEEISSSSDGEIGSSSSRAVSSSSIGAVSSSSGNAVSSSSSRVVSSSSDDEISSSSGNNVGNSSSDGVSSSSADNPSSSSAISSSSSLPVPTLGACSPFPSYVAKTKKEYIKNLVSLEGNTAGCGNITYALSSSGGGPGGGGSIASISGDSINFASASASSTVRNITINASVQCGTQLTKSCPIAVVVADDHIENARCNHEDIFPVNLNIKSATTVIEYACCESKLDYFFTCAGVNYTLKVSSLNTTVTSSGGNANLPNLTPISEPNAQCTPYKENPGGTLYRYPERILMTVTSGLGGGGFSCNSW